MKFEILAPWMVLLAWKLQGVRSFVQTTRSSITKWTTTNTAVQAKATNKKNKNKSAVVSTTGSGGFGSKLAIPNPGITHTKGTEDDYAAFPALETNVKDTLIPCEGVVQQANGHELSSEIYQRLAQIYGFPQFNYLTTAQDNEETEILSFVDMLASSDELGDTLDESHATKAWSSSQANDLQPFLSSLPPFFKFRVLHIDPLVIAVDDFFTDQECDRYIAMSGTRSLEDAPLQSRSKTVGKDALSQSQRTSTTWFHHFKAVPELMAKASRLLGLDGIDQWEEPQTVRYRRKEKFTWHLDALAPSTTLANLGGQRTATLLVYLTDLMDVEGGATMFRDLGGSDGPLRVRPKKGSALIFFPAAGGIPNAPFDIRTLHCGEAVSEDALHDKWIAQLWLRQSDYEPTAPPGNTHAAAFDAISTYCTTSVAHMTVD